MTLSVTRGDLQRLSGNPPVMPLVFTRRDFPWPISCVIRKRQREGIALTKQPGACISAKGPYAGTRWAGRTGNARRHGAPKARLARNLQVSTESICQPCATPSLSEPLPCRRRGFVGDRALQAVPGADRRAGTERQARLPSLEAALLRYEVTRSPIRVSVTVEDSTPQLDARRVAEGLSERSDSAFSDNVSRHP